MLNVSCRAAGTIRHVLRGEKDVNRIIYQSDKRGRGNDVREGEANEAGFTSKKRLLERSPAISLTSRSVHDVSCNTITIIHSPRGLEYLYPLIIVGFSVNDHIMHILSQR